MKPIKLGVNIDHVATLRQARLTRYPEPAHAALIAEQAGADSITIHLREDRRHIQERDVEMLKDVLTIPINLEMAVTDDMVKFAERLKPAYCCFVPERREELTTGGRSGSDRPAGQDQGSLRQTAGKRLESFIVHRRRRRPDRCNGSHRRRYDRNSHRPLCGLRRRSITPV